MREQQDEFALGSQLKVSAAQRAGRFKDEIVAVTVKTRKGYVVVSDDDSSATTPPLRKCGKAACGLLKDGHGYGGQCFGVS